MCLQEIGYAVLQLDKHTTCPTNQLWKYANLPAWILSGSSFAAWIIKGYLWSGCQTEKVQEDECISHYRYISPTHTYAKLVPS